MASFYKCGPTPPINSEGTEEFLGNYNLKIVTKTKTQTGSGSQTNYVEFMTYNALTTGSDIGISKNAQNCHYAFMYSNINCPFTVWDSITDAYGMFSYCSKFNSPVIFYQNNNLTKNYMTMFMYCWNFYNGGDMDLGNNQFTQFRMMFLGTKLTSTTNIHFPPTNAENIYGFQSGNPYACPAYTTAFFSGTADPAEYTSNRNENRFCYANAYVSAYNCSYGFYGCCGMYYNSGYKYAGFIGNVILENTVVNASHMFYGTQYYNGNVWIGENVNNTRNMFYNCGVKRVYFTKNSQTGKIEIDDMSSMFGGFSDGCGYNGNADFLYDLNYEKINSFALFFVNCYYLNGLQKRTSLSPLSFYPKQGMFSLENIFQNAYCNVNVTINYDVWSNGYANRINGLLWCHGFSNLYIKGNESVANGNNEVPWKLNGLNITSIMSCTHDIGLPNRITTKRIYINNYFWNSFNRNGIQGVLSNRDFTNARISIQEMTDGNGYYITINNYGMYNKNYRSYDMNLLYIYNNYKG